MTDSAPRPTAEVTYVGRRARRGGGTGHYFRASWIDDPNELISWKNQRRSPGPLGGVFTIEHDGNPDDGVYINTLTYQRTDADDSQLAEWRAADEAAHLKDQAVKAEKRADTDNRRSIESWTLTEAADWIATARPQDRAARLVVILRAIGAA